MTPFDHEAVPALDHRIRVATTINHFTPTIKEILDTVSPVEIVRLGGAGNKCNHLALGTVDAYIYPSAGLKYWDLCAPESIIKGMGGYSTNLMLQKLTYPLTGDRKIKGLILARNPPMHRLIEKRMGNILKKILAKL